MLFQAFTVLILSVSAFGQLPAFDADRAYADLKSQCAFGPRNPGSEAHRKCLEWLTQQFRDLGLQPTLQTFSGADPEAGVTHRLTNLIVRIPGQQGDPLMLCAHWDSRPRADRDPDSSLQNQPIPGANDGASGVAVLLEIARLAAQSQPPRTLLIALWDGEDLGRATRPEEFALGSRYWAAHQVPEPPSEAILLDMVGDADLEIPVEQFSDAGAPELRRRLWELARELELPAFVDRWGAAVEDDHLSLLRAGIPAVDLIDFDYDYWHTTADTPDKCSAESLGEVGRLLISYIYGK